MMTGKTVGSGLSLASESSADQENRIVPECQAWITMAGRWIRGMLESRVE